MFEIFMRFNPHNITIKEKIEQNIKINDGYFDPIIKVYNMHVGNTNENAKLSSNEMQDKINQYAKQMGIKNKIQVVIDPNVPGQAIGMDHHLSTPTVIFDSETPRKFTIMHELAHIKHGHCYMNNSSLYPEENKIVDSVFSIFFSTYIYSVVMNRWKLGVVAAMGLYGAYIIMKVNMKKYEQEADLTAAKYCTKDEIKEQVNIFKKYQKYHKYVYKSGRFISLNKNGDVRYIFDSHPYDTDRINYLEKIIQIEE